MAVNEALIKGARDAAPKFRKVELFSEATKTAMNTAIASRKAEKMLRDQQISAIVGELQEVDISVTPPEQINQQYEISGNIRNQVAALAAQKAKLPQNSPEAFAIQQMINQKKQMFSQVVNNAKDFKNLHEEYIKAEGWNMSAGVDPEKRKQLDAIFIDKNYTIEYDENGSPTYKTEFGEMSQKDLSNYFVKDDEMALSVTNYSEEVLTSGEQGTKLEGARKDILYRKILNDINKGGPSRLKSLIYDDLVEGQSLGLSEDATAEDAAEAIVRNLINVNNQGLAIYEENQKKINNKKQKEQELTPGEKQRREKAQKDKEYVRNGLQNMSPPNPDLLVKPKKDKDGILVAEQMEAENKKVFLDHTMSETNKLLVGKGKIVKNGDRYMLQKVGTSVSGQVLNEVDVTDQMNSYITGDREALFQAIERNIFETESIDYMGSEDDPDLNPNT